MLLLDVHLYFIIFFCPTLLDPLCEKSWKWEDNPLVTDKYMSSLIVSYKKGEKTICVRFMLLLVMFVIVTQFGEFFFSYLARFRIVLTTYIGSWILKRVMCWFGIALLLPLWTEVEQLISVSTWEGSWLGPEEQEFKHFRIQATLTCLSFLKVLASSKSGNNNNLSSNNKIMWNL